MYTKEYTNIKASTKGGMVIDLLEICDEQGMTRRELAEQVGCTVARVGEVIRALKDAVTLVEGSTTHYIVAPNASLPQRTDRRSNTELKVEEPVVEEVVEEVPAPKAPRRSRAKKG